MIWDWNKESCELIGLLHSELVFISCAKSWVTSCLGYITGSTLYCSCPVSWSKLNLEFRGYQCRNQQFFWGAGFSTSVARRKTVVQLGGLGSAVSPPQWGPGTKPQKIFGYLHSEQAQNIALMALWQWTVMKAYTRNQHFWEFGGLSLGS